MKGTRTKGEGDEITRAIDVLNNEVVQFNWKRRKHTVGLVLIQKMTLVGKRFLGWQGSTHLCCRYLSKW